MEILRLFGLAIFGLIFLFLGGFAVFGLVSGLIEEIKERGSDNASMNLACVMSLLLPVGIICFIKLVEIWPK